MADQTIASGQATLTANADKMVAGLKKAEKEARDSAKRMDAAFSGAMKLGVGVVLGGELNEAVKKFAKGIIQAATGVAELNREMERSGKLAGEINKSFGRFQSIELDRIKGISDPERRRAEIDAERDRLNNELSGLGRLRRQAERAQEGFDRGILGADSLAESARNFKHFFAGDLESAQKRATSRVGEFDNKISGLKDSIAALNAEARNLADQPLPPWLAMVLGTAAAGSNLAQAQGNPILGTAIDMVSRLQRVLDKSPSFDEFLSKQLNPSEALIAGSNADGPSFAGAVEEGSREAHTLKLMQEENRRTAREQTRLLEKIEEHLRGLGSF